MRSLAVLRRYINRPPASWRELPRRWQAAPSPAEIFGQTSIRWTCFARSTGFPAQVTQAIGRQRRGFSWTFSFRAPDLNEHSLRTGGATRDASQVLLISCDSELRAGRSRAISESTRTTRQPINRRNASGLPAGYNEFFFMIFNALLYRHGARRGRSNVLPRRAAHDAAEQL
jgi:hypothetical protein